MKHAFQVLKEIVISHSLLIVEVMKLKAPPKVKIFGWRTLKGLKITHPTFILYIEINVNSACIFGASSEEIDEHLFTCPFAVVA